MSLPVLHQRDGRPMADSRDVASFFGKDHKRVLQTIRELHCSPEFRQHNFVPFKIKDIAGESTSHVEMTKNGFAFLAMGFTGAPAAVFKEAYIERFDAMEQELRKVPVPAVPQSLPEALRLAADLADRVAAQDRAIAVLEPRSEALAVIADADGSFCIRDAAKVLNVPETYLTAYLSEQGWIYRREAAGHWVARAERLAQRLMVSKVVPVEIGHGKVWNKPQARITGAGLATLALSFGQPVPPAALIEHAPARA